MLHSLELRRLGVERPAFTKLRHEALRTRNLCLMTHRRFENSTEMAYAHQNYCLAIDGSEKKYVLSSGDMGHIQIHDLQVNAINGPSEYKSLGTVPTIPELKVYSVEWYNVDNGMFLSAGSDGVLRIWNTNSLEVVFEIKFYDKVYSMAMSPIANQHQLIASAFNGKRREIALVDLRTGTSIHKLRGHQPSPMLVKWSTTECFHLATAGLDSKCLLWDVRNSSGPLLTFANSSDTSSDCVNMAHNGPIKSIAFSKDGRNLITHGRDKKVSVWNTNTGDHTGVNFGKLASSEPAALPGHLAVSCVANVVALPSRKYVEIVDFVTGRRLQRLSGHMHQVNACVFDELTQDLYSTGMDGQILVWSHDRMDDQLVKHIQMDAWSDSD